MLWNEKSLKDKSFVWVNNMKYSKIKRNLPIFWYVQPRVLKYCQCNLTTSMIAIGTQQFGQLIGDHCLEALVKCNFIHYCHIKIFWISEEQYMIILYRNPVNCRLNVITKNLFFVAKRLVVKCNLDSYIRNANIK